ncbi:23S rRNA (adenine(2030)-N(6))-methyltransferase RlmJ [Xanthomonas translucens]|uniref:23S rRNA (adenine(2030)-N(6))-methyltransferase RlmJ n=1 Tax=Xanthomonas campestris pv. translucens TaxID=343 RepID=UPI001F60A443|nr:23S rRNA (adenine(2030)-N(6))-methyltransferase RlmJ [Xanthomonas translucens]UNU12049.1 23S rRNA (adenine(2030)-N(6))-methyltransferase RlmJ [Xanthomonas translucens pv. translucens]
MNYRHAYHAGNHADALKHTVLLALIHALKRKDSPFFVLDTHAGRGRYLFAGSEARKTGEAAAGVLKLMGQPTLPEVLERYLRAVQADNPVPVGAKDASPSQKPARPCAGIQLKHYPGSPLLVAQAMREQDRLAACELQPEEAAELKALFGNDRRVQVHAGDGYAAIKAFVPPKAGAAKIGRGLVLIDPPYESQDAEYPLIAAALRETLTRWPQAMCAVWYPIKQRRSLQPFFRKAAAMPAKSALLAELQVRPDDSPLRLNGSGMLLLNPPWQFEQALASALPALKVHLGETGASTRLEWLKREE